MRKKGHKQSNFNKIDGKISKFDFISNIIFFLVRFLFPFFIFFSLLLFSSSKYKYLWTYRIF